MSFEKRQCDPCRQHVSGRPHPSTSRCILLPLLLHFQLNNPLWPDGQLLDNYLFVAVAVVIVWFNRHAMLRRDGAVTQVVPPDHQARQAYDQQ